MELLFLGTSSMVPTKDRNQPALLVSTRNYDLLIDCGEGTQRQPKILNISPNRIKKILITHWHGDHCLGLPGILMTLGQNHYREELELYIPQGTKHHVEAMQKAFLVYLPYSLKVIECSTGTVFQDEHIKIEAARMQHIVPCVNFSIKERDKRRMKLAVIKKLGIPAGPLLGKLQDGQNVIWKGKTIAPEDTTTISVGKKVTYITDTEPTDTCYQLAKDADVLVCEATLKSELSELAIERSHLTPKLAAHIASHAGAKKLILTHFSQRYASIKELEEDAKDVFANVKAAYDFMRVKVT